MGKRRYKPLVSVTLTIGDDPVATIVRGHVNAETFNKATAREGWDSYPDGLDVPQEDLIYEYRIRYRRKNKVWWRKAEPTEKGAKPYTRSAW